MNIQDLEELERLLSRFETYLTEKSTFIESDYRKVRGATDLVNETLMDVYNAVNIGKLITTGKRERLAVLAIKHCPTGHHDWEEIKTLTRRYLK